MSLRRKVSMLYLRIKYGLHINKPKLMLKVIKALMKSKLLKKPVLRYVDLAIDYKCNLKCKHCFARDFLQKSPGRELTLQEYEKLAKEAMELGAYSFDFQGGEPFLFFDKLIEIIKVFKPKENLISVTTNGTFPDKEKLMLLKKIGVDHLIISIDSFVPEIHDNFRGVSGVFEKAMTTLKLAREVGLNVIINTVVSHENIRTKGFLDLIKFAERNGILLNTIFAAPVGGWFANKDVLLTEDDKKFMEALRKKYMFITRDIDHSFLTRGCNALKESIYVTAKGDVLACPFIHISFGNVKEESLKEILNKAYAVKYFDHYHPICLISEDKKFIDNYINLTKNRKSYPISLKEVKWLQKRG